ncbi:hypothetical protein J5A52_05210 [TM7 phylum sp. oral taxon 349]|nr:hypothetical protein J5A52_05210 [TM7 phylum sp. oral taxon 349]
MRVVNLTLHEVKIVDGGNNVVAVFPSDGVARVSQHDVLVDEINSIPVVKTEFGEVLGLPEPAEDTVFIVSRITVEVARARGLNTDDLLITSGAVRDDQGRIVGCRALARL